MGLGWWCSGAGGAGRLGGTVGLVGLAGGWPSGRAVCWKASVYKVGAGWLMAGGLARGGGPESGWPGGKE